MIRSYQNSPTTCPSFRQKIARNVGRFTFSDTNRTLPSHKDNCAPPTCRLRGPDTISPWFSKSGLREFGGECTERDEMNARKGQKTSRSARNGRTRVSRCADHRRDESNGSLQTVNAASQTVLITWLFAAVVSAAVSSPNSEAA